MRGLTEINAMNTKAAVAKEQFLAKAMNNPKGKPKRPRKEAALESGAEWWSPSPGRM